MILMIKMSIIMVASIGIIIIRVAGIVANVTIIAIDIGASSIG